MKKKKKFAEPRWATAHLSIRLGAQALGARARGRQARGARWARQGARPGRDAGPVGCALGALSLFLARFDSVRFLSRFFGHCS